MRALGCDLGLQGAGGLAVVEDGNPPRVLDTVALPERQSGLEFSLNLKVLLELHAPHLVVCEKPWTGRRDPRPSVGMAQRERLGLVKLACEQHGLPKSRLKPIYASVARAILADMFHLKQGDRGKESVRVRTRLLIGGWRPGQGLDEHLADAIGLALAGLQQERVRKAGLKQRAWAG